MSTENEDFNKKIGQRVLEVRKDSGLEQIEFGISIGLKQGSLSDLERGKSNLSDSVKKLLCIVYNVNEGWLLTGKGNKYESAFKKFVRGKVEGLTDDIKDKYIRSLEEQVELYKKLFNK